MSAEAPRWVDRRQMPVVFIHASIDDLGLDPYTFRLYARIARRAGGHGGTCYESVPNMAAACKMSERKAQQCLAELVKLGMVRRVERQAQTSVYILTPESEWDGGARGTPSGEPGPHDLRPHPAPGAGEVTPLEVRSSKPLSTSSTLSAQPIFAEESKVDVIVHARFPGKKGIDPREPGPVAPSADHEAALVALYNQHRGVLPETRRINDALVRQIRRFIKEAGGFEEARTILEHGTKEVAADDFWKKNRFTLKNLLADGKVFRRAEAYEARHEANTPSFSVKDRVRFTTPLGRVEEGVVEALTDKQAVIKQDRDGRIARVPISSVSEVLE